MLIQAFAPLPINKDSLTDSLRTFAEFVRRRLSSREQSQIGFVLFETGARATSVLASKLPADTVGFAADVMTASPNLTAAQFLESLAAKKPKKSNASFRTTAAHIPNLPELLEEFAKLLPENGRGVTLSVHLFAWKISDSNLDAEIDAAFSRHSLGGAKMASVIHIRFHAPSLKDPSVRETIAAASEKLSLTFRNPRAEFAGVANPTPAPPPSQKSTPASPPLPSREQQYVILQSFYEALAQASDETAARNEDLAAIPLLFDKSEGFRKRMDDVTAGKKESINFPQRLKHSMQTHFADYKPDAADPEQIWFRKSIADTFDALLCFDKVHQWGIGKTFTIRFAVDFPGTPFAGIHYALGGASENIFWLFHEAWARKVWAYTTSDELDTALAACITLLQRLLPALEQQSLRLLHPLPEVLPSEIPQNGPLSAREAYEKILPLVRAWAPDAALEVISSDSIFNLPALHSSPITTDGRITPHGQWRFKFASKQLDQLCVYSIHHTGRIWWHFFSVQQGATAKHSAALESDDWLDSTAIAPNLFSALQQKFSDPATPYFSLSLLDPHRYTGNFVWQAQGTNLDAERVQRKQFIIDADYRTGQILNTTER
jgi:hypothetical protein